MKAAAAEQPKPASAPPVALKPTLPPQTMPDSPAAALDRIDAYFNSIDVLTAEFVQNSTNGQRAEGTLYLKRPGQLRFAYAPPSSLEIVSDGRSVAVRDAKLGTNDVYPVGQTPLKFLVQDEFSLARDTKVREVETSADGIVTVSFDDGASLGGTSQVTLRFDVRANQLKQWTVVDPQGFKTSVALSDIEVEHRPSTEVVN